MAHGPFVEYERRIEMTDRGLPEETAREVIEYRLAILIWEPFVDRLVRRFLRHRRPRFDYWWAPPDRPDARAARVLALLCAAQIIDGYLGTVLTQTLTFAADEFGQGNAAGLGARRGACRGGVRPRDRGAGRPARAADDAGVRLAAGERAAPCSGALAEPWVLGATQLVTQGPVDRSGSADRDRGGRGDAGAEPGVGRADARAVGRARVRDGGVVLPVADLDPRGWRLIYLLAGRRCGGDAVGRTSPPESQRFAAVTVRPKATDRTPAPRRRQRLLLLAASAFLLSMFFALSSFQNDFLKDERGFDATRITVFTLLTSTPGVASACCSAADWPSRAGAARSARSGSSSGPVSPRWRSSPTVPSVGAHPGRHAPRRVRRTGTRGVRARALRHARPGAGERRRGDGRRPRERPASCSSVRCRTVSARSALRFAILLAGPLLVAGLVMTRYPETAGLELEEINPEDA
ncbi:MAG: hypothetical protein R2695_05375 [Acidimicrobiales bacterium]